MTDQKIKNIADQMGVNAADVKCLADSVVNSIQRDDMIETFMLSDYVDQLGLTGVYIDRSGNPESFVMTCMVKQEFHSIIHASLLPRFNRLSVAGR